MTSKKKNNKNKPKPNKDSDPSPTAQDSNNGGDKKIITDARFASVHSDPRFQNVPRHKSKVAIDSRFDRMFKDKSFASSSAPLDKRGKRKKPNQESHLRHYYKIEEEEKEKEKEEEEEEKKEISSSSDEEEEEDEKVVEDGRFGKLESETDSEESESEEDSENGELEESTTDTDDTDEDDEAVYEEEAEEDLLMQV